MVTRDVFQVLKLHSPGNLKNIPRAHTSRNVLAFIRFPILILLLLLLLLLTLIDIVVLYDQ